MNQPPAHLHLFAGVLNAPALYSTEDVPVRDKMIVAHYHAPTDSHWWIAEFDWDDFVGFGYAMLNSDATSAEWGYISFLEFYTANELYTRTDGSPFIQCDEDWVPKPAWQVIQGL